MTHAFRSINHQPVQQNAYHLRSLSIIGRSSPISPIAHGPRPTRIWGILFLLSSFIVPCYLPGFSDFKALMLHGHSMVPGPEQLQFYFPFNSNMIRFIFVPQYSGS